MRACRRFVIEIHSEEPTAPLYEINAVSMYDALAIAWQLFAERVITVKEIAS